MCSRRYTSAVPVLCLNYRNPVVRRVGNPGCEGCKSYCTLMAKSAVSLVALLKMSPVDVKAFPQAVEWIRGMV